MSVFFERLREERKKLKLNQTDFASLAGVTVDSQGNYERGSRKPDSDYLEAIASAGVDVPYLITGRRSLSGPMPEAVNDEDAQSVPVMAAQASMGPGHDGADGDVVLGHITLSRRWMRLHLPGTRPEALQLIHAHGDSMKGTLEAGDMALVDTDCTAPDVDGVYVLRSPEHLFIKRVTRRLAGGHDVTSDNPSVRTAAVLDGTQQIRVLGRVVYGWNGRRF